MDKFVGSDWIPGLRRNATVKQTAIRTCRAEGCGHQNKLEARYCANCGAGVTSVSAEIPKLSEWKTLKEGMTKDDVLRVLGKPKREQAWGGVSPHVAWYYSDDSSNSSVSFDAADGNLSRWEEPEFPNCAPQGLQEWWNLRLGMTKEEVVKLLVAPAKDQGGRMSYVWETAEGWVEFLDGRVCGMGLEDIGLYESTRLTTSA